MGTPAAKNTSFQITIAKDVATEMDNIIDAINEIRKDSEEKKVTRSNFIETLIVAFIMSHVKDVNDTTEEVNKEVKENA